MPGRRPRTEAHLCNPVLVCSHSRNNTKCLGIDLLPPIASDTDHDLLPAAFPSRFTPFSFVQMRDVLYNTMHRMAEQLLVFIVQWKASVYAEDRTVAGRGRIQRL